MGSACRRGSRDRSRLLDAIPQYISGGCHGGGAIVRATLALITFDKRFAR